MATKILLKHKETGLMKEGCYGFSWTYFFFGCFVPIFRGEMLTAALHLLFIICSLSIFWWVEMFLYNKQYMTRMLTSGWELAGSEEENKSAKAALGMLAVVTD